MAVPYLTATQLYADTTLKLNEFEVDADQVAGYVSEFEQIVEDARGVAFTPRVATGELIQVPGPALFGGCGVTVPSVFTYWPKIRGEITALTVSTLDPVDYDVTTLAVAWDIGQIFAPYGFQSGSNIVVTYPHGYDTPDSATNPYGRRILRACGQYVRAVSNRDLNATGRDVVYQSVDGQTTRYSTPNAANDQWTGYIEIDRLIASIPMHRAPVTA